MGKYRFESNAKINFVKMSDDIYNLLNLYGEIDNTKIKLKKEKRDLVIRTTYVFTAACWESYLEDLVKEAYDFLMKSGGIKSKRWLEQILTMRVKQLIKKFNTPRAENVDNLFRDIIGLNDVCLSWAWNELNHKETKVRLGTYLSARGGIAHRTMTSHNITKIKAEDFLDLIETLVNQTEISVQGYVKNIVGKNFGKKVV